MKRDTLSIRIQWIRNIDIFSMMMADMMIKMKWDMVIKMALLMAITMIMELG